MRFLRPASPKSFFGFATLALLFILAGLVLLAPPDGNERARLLQFFGRFHPLSVHLPIALLILVPLIELAGRTRFFPGVSSASPFVLGVALCGAIAAAALGWCLGRGGGYSGPLVTQHMWAAIALAALAWVCWFLRVHASPTEPSRAYAISLMAAAVLVSFTGYRGGQLSQGENHLTEFLPAPLDSWLGTFSLPDAPANSPNGGPDSFYGARIQPVLAKHCIACHGRSKHKGNLRLDYYEAVLRGGKHGVVIKAGDTRGSELLRRITLSPSDDAFMPPDNKPAIPAGEVKLIDQWIASGASGTLAADGIKGAEAAPASTPPPEVTFAEEDPQAVARDRSALAAAVAQFQRLHPNVLDYQSRNSADLVVNAAWMGPRFGDPDASALAPLSDRIVAADFSGTAITDKSAPTIAAMKQLRELRLMHAAISDATIRALAPLAQLEVLNLFGTRITPNAVPVLGRLPKIRRIYAGETALSAATALPREFRGKLVF